MTGVEVGVGAAIAAIGAGVTTYAQQSSLQKQYNATAAGIQQQDQLNQEANQKTQATIAQIANNQKTNNTTTAGQQTAAYQKALSEAANAVPSGVQTLGGASKKYQEAASGVNASDAAFGNTQAGVMGQVTAPGMTNLANQQALISGESQLGLLEGQSQQKNYLTQLAVASQQPNPWITGLGQTAEGAGEGMVSSGIYGSMFNPSSGSGALQPVQVAAVDPDAPIQGNLGYVTPVTNNMSRGLGSVFSGR